MEDAALGGCSAGGLILAVDRSTIGLT